MGFFNKKNGFESGDVPPTKDYIPSLNATVTELKFYNGGSDNVDRSQRQYGLQFSQSDTRYILWELNLSHPDPGRRIDFKIVSVYYGPDGKVINRSNIKSYLLSGWIGSYRQHGYGWQNPGNWTPGKYRVEFLVKGQRIGSESFEIIQYNKKTAVSK